jgi:hypothetical protein
VAERERDRDRDRERGEKERQTVLNAVQCGQQALVLFQLGKRQTEKERQRNRETDRDRDADRDMDRDRGEKQTAPKAVKCGQQALVLLQLGKHFRC